MKLRHTANVQALIDLKRPTGETDPVKDWGHGYGFISAVKAYRVIHPGTLIDTLNLMANEFGFQSWAHWQDWLRDNQLDFSMVTGPHAITILKAIAIKHGRSRVKED